MPRQVWGIMGNMKNDKKPNNARTAMILFSVALIFFIGVFVKQTLLR